MKLTVFIEKTNLKQEISLAGETVSDLLTHLKLNPETVIVLRNSEVITEKEALAEDDHLEIISVISGG